MFGIVEIREASRTRAPIIDGVRVSQSRHIGASVRPRAGGMGYSSRPQARNGMGQRLRTPYCDRAGKGDVEEGAITIAPQEPLRGD